MALVPTLTGCFIDNCKTIRLTDTTGAYSSTNTGGWGTPNTTLALADPVTITITFPSGSESEFDVTSTVNAATISGGEFPLIDIETSDITGFTDDQFEDGVYTIEYSVTDSDTGTEYLYTIKVLNICSIECCLTKKLTEFCSKYKTCEWNKIWSEYNYMEALIYAIKCEFGRGNYSAVEDGIESVEKICRINKCQC